MLEKTADMTEDGVRGNEPTPIGVIVAAAEVVEADFVIVNVTTITEGVQRAKAISERAGLADLPAPCIITVLDYKTTRTILQTEDISLQRMHITIGSAVIQHHVRTSSIIIDVQFTQCAVLYMYYPLAL